MVGGLRALLRCSSEGGCGESSHTGLVGLCAHSVPTWWLGERVHGKASRQSTYRSVAKPRCRSSEDGDGPKTVGVNRCGGYRSKMRISHGMTLTMGNARSRSAGQARLG